MTTFQDPQPQSRRAVRQSERGESAESSVGFTQFPPTAAPAVPQTYSDPDAPRDMWDTTARRAAQLPPAAPAVNPQPSASGRRAAGSDQQQPAGEPLNYTTQQRPSVPSYDGPSFRSRPAAPAPENDALPPTQAIPKADQPAYRVRDFSPEGRRAAPATQPSWNAPAAPSPASAAVPPTPLEYHTEARVAAPAATTAPVPAPVAEVPADIAVPHERTLTRRELRAMQEAQLASAPAPVAPAAPAQQSAPVQQATPAPQAAVAPAAVEPAVAGPVAAEPIAAEPIAADEPQAWPFGNLSPEPAAEVVDEPIAPVAAAVTTPPALVEPTPALPNVAPEPTTNTALTNAIAEFDALTQAPLPEARIEEPPSNQWTAPVGHWSTQAILDDETQPYESTINRTVGSGTVTTSALVLPAIPEGSDIRGPLTGTGEIMLTGSIDLPREFTSTGATARVESQGIDALFDLHDAEVVPTDSQPVRAISAVSTHNSGQGVTHTQKPKGTKALTALVISAASMAVVVVGLLVAVFALNIF